jgi:hypothetical protein
MEGECPTRGYIGKQLAKAFKAAMLWAAVALGIIVLYTYRGELRDVYQRVMAELMPGVQSFEIKDPTHWSAKVCASSSSRVPNRYTVTGFFSRSFETKAIFSSV